MIGGILSITMLAVASLSAVPSETESVLKGGVAALAPGIGVHFVQPDVALAHTLITPNILKGEVGEALMHTNLTRQLGETGNWVSVQSRSGPHGIDGIYLKIKNGRLEGIIVGESKYGSSQLSKGQMTEKWTAQRLGNVANQYKSVGADLDGGQVRLGQQLPRAKPSQVVDVILKNGEQVTFWRNSPKDPWSCTAAQIDSKTVGQRAKVFESYLSAAAEGRIAVRRHVYRTQIQDDIIHFEIHDVVDEVDGKAILSKNPRSLPPLKLTAAERTKLKGMTAKEASSILQKKMPRASADDCDYLANQILEKGLDHVLRGSTRRQFYGTLAMNSIMIGLTGAVAGGALDLGIQFASGDEIDWSQVAQTGALGVVSAAGGGIAGQAVTLRSTQSRVLNAVASRLGCGSVLTASRVLGAGAGGAVGAILFAYGGALTGAVDWHTANIMAGTGAIGAAASAAVLPVLTTWLGAAGGTTVAASSTATAALGASSSWFGGGIIMSTVGGASSLAIGAISFGVGTVATIAATSVVTWYYSSQDAARLDATIAELLEVPYYQAFAPPHPVAG